MESIYIYIYIYIYWPNAVDPRGVRRGSTAGRLLGLEVHISPGAMDVCELSGGGLCDWLITHPEGFYRVRGV